MERDRGNKDKSPYLESKRQLVIAAKVNRICVAEPGDFDEDLVQDAREVVEALDPRVKISSKFSLTGTFTSPGRSIKGATEHGEASASTGKTERRFQFGLEEYRIGGYIATKSKSRRLSTLTFESFFGRGFANTALGKVEPITEIAYEKEELGLVRIRKGVAVVRKLGILKFITYDYAVFWEVSK